MITEYDSSEEQESPRCQATIAWLLAAGILACLCCVTILASVPPVSRDALIHHLVVPKMYLAHGGIYEIPSMHFSYFPMNLDLLYMIPLYLDFDIGAKYIHFLFALLTAGLIYRYLKAGSNRIYALIGALLFLSTPIVVKLSVTAYVDLGLIFFSWATLFCFVRWYDNDFSKRYLVSSGIACGLALGTKYNGLILLLIMSTLIPLTYSMKTNQAILRRDYKKRYQNSVKGAGFGIVFILIALTVFSPWMIRNVVWKHNPVYPLFNSVFNPPGKVAVDKPVQQEKKAPRNAFWMRRHVYHESFLQTLLIPVRAFFQGQDNNPKYFDGKLNPFLLFFSILAFLPSKSIRNQRWKQHRRFFLIFSVLFPLFVLFRADYRIRYMAPALPAVVVLSVFGLQNLCQMIRQRGNIARRYGWTVVSILLFITLALNVKYIYGQFGYIRPIEYITGKVDRDAYITRYRSEYPVIEEANRILPESARVLCLSIGDRTYYLKRSAHLAEDFYKKVDGSYSEAVLLKRLHRYGTTHIIIDTNIFFRWMISLSVDDRRVFENAFQKNTELLYQKNGVRLLSLQQP